MSKDSAEPAEAVGASPEQLAIIKQLQEMDLSHDREGWLAEQPPHMRKRFEAMHALQDEVDAYNKQFAEERRALELKYRNLCAPKYEARRQIVQGERVPEGGEGQEKGIPGFWAKVIAGNENFQDVISEKDAQILEHLIDISCQHVAPDEEQDTTNWGFKLIFKFNENEFFEGTALIKTYLFEDEDQSVLSKSTGTKISWKSGKDPTQKVMKKKGKKGVIKYKTEPVESFFNFFTPPPIPGEDDDEAFNQEDMEELEEAIETDYELGSLFKDELLPNALKWYTGEAALEQGFEFGDEDDEDEEDDDGDEEDEEDDDEDNEDEDAAAPVAPPPQKQGEECKQQ